MQRRTPRLLRLLTSSALAVSVAGLGVAATAAPATAAGPFTIDTGRLDIVLDSTGTVTGLVDETTGKDYSSPTHPEPLIKLVANGAEALPTAVTYNASTSTYDFTFGGANDTHALVKVTPKGAYSTLEVTALTPGSGIDVSVLMWGPITTSITHKVGEAVGAAYTQTFAIVARPLNDKTIGGWMSDHYDLSYKEDHFTPQMPFVLSSALRTSWGSIIQHYTYDHTVPRLRDATFGQVDQEHPALPGDEGRIVGSKIAVFGAAPSSVLSTISGIQTGEGLVHPTIDGEWDKTSRKAQESFLVLEDLNQSNVALASQYAKQAGMSYIYALTGAVGPWSSTGHYGFDGSFGGSDAGAKTLVDTAASYGVRVGVHTISNFINGGDPYTHPVPHGLALTGTTTLTRDITSTATDIYVASNSPFIGGLGHHIQLGNELAEYGSVTQVSATEWKLSGVSRGIWGTTKAARTTGQTLQRVAGDQYGGAIGSVETDAAIGTRMATIHNTVGTRAMSYDGLEGTTQSGYGTYGASRMVNGTYRQLTGAAKIEGLITEASNIYPNVWDSVTRLSWGEDGNGIVTRSNYVRYFQRSFTQGGMGWQRLTTNLPAMEAHLAKMAGNDAFAGWRVSMGTLNGMTATARNAMFEAHKQWEAARQAGAFTPGQRNRLRDLDDFWHLSVVTPGVEWSLQKTDSTGAPIGSSERVFVGNTDPAPAAPNLALSANVTASTEYSGYFVGSNVIDGTTQQDGVGEWASRGEPNPWIRLTWDTAQTLSKVTLYDRPNGEGVNSGQLRFSDGSTVAVTGVPNTGAPLEVTFPDRSVTWVEFRATGGTGTNVGLSEFEASDPESDLALSAQATASSSYNANYAPSKAIDATTGLSNTGEWASQGTVNPWLQLTWSKAVTLNTISLFDRPNSVDNANSGTLTFSDGTTVAVTGIPTNGTPKAVSFPDKTVTWVKFQVTGGAGANVGLSEIAAVRLDPANLAPSATVTGSPAYDNRYLVGNAVDGITGHVGFGEYATSGQANPWIQLDWAAAKRITRVVLSDRPNGGDNVNGGTLTFSDGSTVTVTGIPTDGSPKAVTIPARNATWVKFQAVGGTGSNGGLDEIQVFGDPPVNAAREASATASSSYDNRYVPANAVDGVTGQTGTGEWASLGEAHPWLRLDWAAARTINTIRIHDRPNGADNANSGTLTFSDGTSVAVSGIPTDGTPKVVTFANKTITWVKFDATGGTGGNVGLAELEALQP